MILKFKSPYRHRHDRDDLTYSLCDIINGVYKGKDIDAKPVTILGEKSQLYIFIETSNNSAQFICQLGYDLGKLSEELLQLA
jgi:hypothetical protein